MIENLKIGDLFLLLSIFQLYYLLISMFFEFINGKIESHLKKKIYEKEMRYIENYKRLIEVFQKGSNKEIERMLEIVNYPPLSF